jgi:hypothetical protein
MAEASGSYQQKSRVKYSVAITFTLLILEAATECNLNNLGMVANYS